MKLDVSQLKKIILEEISKITLLEAPEQASNTAKELGLRSQNKIPCHSYSYASEVYDLGRAASYKLQDKIMSIKDVKKLKSSFYDSGIIDVYQMPNGTFAELEIPDRGPKVRVSLHINAPKLVDMSSVTPASVTKSPQQDF